MTRLSPAQPALVAAAILLAACSTTGISPSAAPTSATASPTPSPTPSAAAATPSPAPTTAAIGWRQLPAAGSVPAAREDHTWTLEPDGAAAYLFGGRDGALAFDDLWAYDLAGNAWTRLAPSGASPSARFGHNAAWVDGIGLVIFAGQVGSTFFNDLWAYDPATNAWRQLPAAGAVPVSRYGSCAAIGPDGRLWISHGFTSEGQRFSDTRAYDFASGSWTNETPAGDVPISRCLHACWWTDTGSLVLYAGQTTGVVALGDLWSMTVGPRPGTNAWTELEPADGLPPDRNLYAAARWGQGTLVFGGQSLDGQTLADAWWLDDEGRVGRLEVGTAAPPGRSGAELVADPAGGRLLLFGGRSGATAFDDLWVLVLPGFDPLGLG